MNSHLVYISCHVLLRLSVNTIRLITYILFVITSQAYSLYNLYSVFFFLLVCLTCTFISLDVNLKCNCLFLFLEFLVVWMKFKLWSFHCFRISLPSFHLPTFSFLVLVFVAVLRKKIKKAELKNFSFVFQV